MIIVPQIRARAVIKGALTFVPGLGRLACGSSGGTNSARYCYSVWLRHLRILHDAGMPPPRVVAELGPGDSLGIGLAAVLSGADRYYAVDAKAHARSEVNAQTLEELINLFGKRAPIPNGTEFPRLLPRLRDYAFPSDALDEERLSRLLAPRRISAIREAVTNGAAGGITVEYVVPWHRREVLPADSVDLLFSQAVLEHVDDVRSAYDAMYYWLKPGGWMSHQIDFDSHGLTRDWNGHWTVNDGVWKIVRGRRPYLINREPRSAHLAAIRKVGFEIVRETAQRGAPVVRRLLAKQFRSLSDEDLSTSALHVLAVKAAGVSRVA